MRARKPPQTQPIAAGAYLNSTVVKIGRVLSQVSVSSVIHGIRNIPGAVTTIQYLDASSHWFSLKKTVVFLVMGGVVILAAFKWDESLNGAVEI